MDQKAGRENDLDRPLKQPERDALRELLDTVAHEARREQLKRERAKRQREQQPHE